MAKVSMISPIYLDMVFSGINRMPNEGEELFAENFDLQLGGGALAPAIILNRLNIEVNLGTFLHKGYLSELAKKMLEKEDLKFTNFYQGNKEPVVITSIMSFAQDRSMISYDSMKQTSYSFTEQQLYDFLKDSKICYVIEGYDAVYRKLSAEGSILFFDLGWDDYLNLSDYKELLSYTDVFLPNDKEAMHITGTKNAQEACRILKDYVKHPIVKIGAQGALTYYHGKVVQIPMPKKFNAIDTTGAGDNFMAGVMYGLMMDWDIIKAIQWGNILGGVSTTGIGCYGANPDYTELFKLMENNPL